jgi:RNA polymerase sigma-70 factor (ECF subfamily)
MASTTGTTDPGFDLDLTASLPRLRAYAMSLTRSGDRADDLVQQTVMKALAGRRSFRAGTNFSAWIFRIERNEFVSELRRTRPTVDIDLESLAAPSTAPRQESGLVMREFMAAFRQLSGGSRQALLLGHLEGLSQQQIASHAGIAVGTVKSRISRARTRLARLLAPTIDTPRDTRRGSIQGSSSPCQPS